MNFKTLLLAHFTSLKLLLVQVLILPWKIYTQTINRLGNYKKESETDFKVLQWFTQCYDALIVLSYTAGFIFLFLSLIQVIPRYDNPLIDCCKEIEREITKNEWESPMENEGWRYMITKEGERIDGEENYYSDETSLSSDPNSEVIKDNQFEGATYWEVQYKGYVSTLYILIYLGLLYFVPFAIHLIKEFFSIAIIQAIRIGEIARNTKKQ